MIKDEQTAARLDKSTIYEEKAAHEIPGHTDDEASDYEEEIVQSGPDDENTVETTERDHAARRGTR